jgi:hypothetical protein
MGWHDIELSTPYFLVVTTYWLRQQLPTIIYVTSMRQKAFLRSFFEVIHIV